MATIDATGAHGRDLTGYIAMLQEKFRAAFGDDMTFEDETPQSQIIGIMAAALTENDEALVADANSLSLDRAFGVALDDLGTIYDLQRFPATKTTVTATVTGEAGTIIPAGSRARKADGSTFETLEVVNPTPDGAQVEMRALNAGPIDVPIGSLTIISTPIVGWETINNLSAGNVGTSQESDVAYSRRLRVISARQAVGSLPALAASLDVAGATDHKIVENFQDVARKEQLFELRPHSILLVVKGGTDAEITERILEDKSGGVGLKACMRGGLDVTTDDITSTDRTIRWRGESFTVATRVTTLTAYANSIQGYFRRSTNEIIAETQVHYDGKRFVFSYPWQHNVTPAPPTGNGAGAIKMRDRSGELYDQSPGPFIRPQPRDYSVSATVAVQTGFPADGLLRLRAAALAVANAYRVGDRPWPNDILAAMEGVPGTQVTAFAVTDGDDTITDIDMPLDVIYQLPAGNLEITLTGV